MSIPRRIGVLGHSYRVKQTPGLAQDTGLDGLCDPKNRLIYLDKGLSPRHKHRVFLHELMHAYQFESGFCDVLDEQACELLAEGLASFLCSSARVSFKR